MGHCLSPLFLHMQNESTIILLLLKLSAVKILPKAAVHPKNAISWIYPRLFLILLIQLYWWIAIWFFFIVNVLKVSSKHLKGGKESKMDVLVMENLLYRRNVTRLYDLKGCSRSRYNPDTSGNNKVLLDQNLIEAMPTSPIFVGNQAKRLLERAVWNDTSFLAVSWIWLSWYHGSTHNNKISLSGFYLNLVKHTHWYAFIWFK